MKMRMAMLSLAALLALVGISIWATAQQPIGDAIAMLVEEPRQQPWFVATLFDTYFGFLWFWAWVAYRETSSVARAAWLVLILALGNIAMAAYVLLALRRLPAGAPAEAGLLRRG
jgi:hypothetical protein